MFRRWCVWGIYIIFFLYDRKVLGMGSSGLASWTGRKGNRDMGREGGLVRNPPRYG